MKPPFRIAVLECDTPLEQTKEKYGGYFGVFKALLESGADRLAHPSLNAKDGLVLSGFHVQRDQNYPALDDVDAVLISGSRFNSFDNDEWILKLVEFVKLVLQQRRVRLIGVCFGHQIIGRALDVEVGRSDGGWEIAVLPLELSPKGKELFQQDVVSLHQMHRDAVFTYPAGIEALASSPRCAVQGMYAKGRLITVQGHPEFNEEIVRELVEARYAQGIFTDELYKDAIARVPSHHDGVAVAQAFLRFLLED